MKPPASTALLLCFWPTRFPPPPFLMDPECLSVDHGNTNRHLVHRRSPSDQERTTILMTADNISHRDNSNRFPRRAPSRYTDIVSVALRFAYSSSEERRCRTGD